jgi:hypothetical protein
MLSLSNVEATPARTYDEVAATRTMIDRTEKVFGAKAERLAADTAYGTGKMLAWLLDKGITPHIPVWEEVTACSLAPTSPTTLSVTSISVRTENL